MNHALVRYNTYEHFVESLFTLSFNMLQSNYTKSKKGADTASTFPKGDDKAGRGAKASKYKNPTNDVGVTMVWGIDDIQKDLSII